MSPTIRVGSLVPEGFDAYARVLHPASGIDADGSERRIRWGMSPGTAAQSHMRVWSDISDLFNTQSFSGKSRPTRGRW